MKKLKVKDLWFSYSKTPVLKEINFSADKNDFVVVVGPNGSGKTTLIKCINKILNHKNGLVQVDNTSTKSMSQNEIARTIGYVPQRGYYTFTTTIFDIVLMGRKPYAGWKPTETDLQKTSAILEELKLGDIAMRNMHQLSGGQGQLSIIGRALNQEPDILLLDEPTSSLDIKHQIEVLNVLKGLTKKGMLVILAIHDLNLALRYCNKVIMMKAGEIFTQGGLEIINEKTVEAVYEIKVDLIKHNNDIIVIPKTNNH